jgi:hypothetical protein
MAIASHPALPFAWLDRRLSPHVLIFRRPLPAFQVWGVAGLCCALALAACLTVRRGLELPVMAALFGGAIANFFALVIVKKIITGRENLVYYQHEIAVFLQAALILRLLSRPVLPYLDITAIAVGCFLAFGRVGCLMVGCCHGRPAGAGIRYTESHGEAGFTRSLVEVPLVPVQLIEACWAFLIVLACAAWLASGSRPGEAFASYVAAYAIGRFWLEYWRGDPRRPYWRGSSAAQWISLVSAGLIVREEFTGALPFHYWHAAAAALLAGVSLVNALRGTNSRRILRAGHIEEMAESLARLSRRDGGSPGIPVIDTSLGIRISCGTLRENGGEAYHYTFSRRGGSLTPEEARKLALLTFRLRRHSEPYLVMRGASGAWHVVAGSVASAPSQQAVEPAPLAGFPMLGRPIV